MAFALSFSCSPHQRAISPSGRTPAPALAVSARFGTPSPTRPICLSSLRMRSATPAGFVESGANAQDQSSIRRTRTPPVLVISAAAGAQGPGARDGCRLRRRREGLFPVWRFPDGSHPRSYEAGSTRSLGHLTRCRRTRPRTAGRPWRSARTARGAADRAPGERGLAGRERLIARGERDGGALRHRKHAAAAGPTGAALESAPGTHGSCSTISAARGRRGPRGPRPGGARGKAQGRKSNSGSSPKTWFTRSSSCS